MDESKLQQSERAYAAICELLHSWALSIQTKRHLQNLKQLLELEIAALRTQESQPSPSEPGADASDQQVTSS